MGKYNLNEIIRCCKDYEGQVLFQEGQISVIDEEQCIYCDTRTKYDEDAGIHDVFAVAYEANHYAYICPSCGQIHKLHKDEVNGRLIVPGCWNWNSGRNGKKVAILDNGVLMKFPLQKIRFHKEGGGSQC